MTRQVKLPIVTALSFAALESLYASLVSPMHLTRSQQACIADSLLKLQHTSSHAPSTPSAAVDTVCSTCCSSEFVRSLIVSTGLPGAQLPAQIVAEEVVSITQDSWAQQWAPRWDGCVLQLKHIDLPGKSLAANAKRKRAKLAFGDLCNQLK